jgi:tripartite-type tricarboxylate transporter receptor subunit TctC
MNYDPVKDFEPVSRFVSFPDVLVVPSSLGVRWA